MLIRWIQDATAWAQDWGSDAPLVGGTMACVVLLALVLSLFKTDQ